MKFKYNNKIYNPVNLEKKLKKIGISINDIEIIQEEPKIIEYNSIELFHFKNKNTKETISSIYDNLENLKEYININEYERQT